MGLKSILSIFRRKGMTSSDLLKIIVEQNRSKAGVAVNDTTALKVATVFACLRVISEGVAQVPLKIFFSDGENRVDAKSHSLYDILHRQPNDIQTSFGFRETLVIHAALTGNGYAYIVRDPSTRKIFEIINLVPSMVKTNEAENIGDKPTYRVYGKKGDYLDLPKDKILHVQGPSWDGVSGMNSVAVAREAIGLSLTTEEAHSRLHKNGSHPGGLLSVEGSLDGEQYKQLRKWIDENHGGVGNSGRDMILDHAAKYTSMAMTGVDSQHIETRRFQIEEVCRFFRVMPIMVMQSDKAATYASSEQMFLAHVIHTLMPWYQRLEETFDTQLLTPDDRKKGYYVKFVHQGLLRGALKDTAEYLYKLISIGMMTRNEGRKVLELNPIDGLDEPLTPANLMGVQNEQ